MWLRLEVPIEEFDRDEWEHSDNVVEGKCTDGVQVMFERVDAVIGDTLTFANGDTVRLDDLTAPWTLVRTSE